MTDNQKLQIEYSGLTHIGMVRTENQDSFGKFPESDLNLYSEKGQLFVVADGMGGHSGGKQASSIAVDTVCRIYSESGQFNIADALLSSIVAANSKIYEAAGKSSELSRMGTTCTALVMHEENGIIGHVGDSRVYRIEHGKIEQITEDHTQVQAMLKEGVLTPEEAKVYPSKSVLARALGVEEKVKVDILQNITLRTGQAYLLCSDGLAKVTESEILKIVTDNSTEIACKMLVELANERGGKDNVTVQIIKIGTKKSVPLPSPEIINETKVLTPEPKKNKTLIYTSVILILLVLAGYAFKDSITSLFSSESTPVDEESIVISNNGELGEEGNDIYKDLLLRADRHFKSGRFETAMDLYKEILDEAPMNLAAIQGINNVALSFIKIADEKMSENNFEEALSYYYKVEVLQPENEKVKSLIRICENQINYSSTEIPVINEPVQQNLPKETGIVVVTNFHSAEWNFLNLPSNQYNLGNHEIEFAASSTEKKSIFRQDLTNAEISVEIKSNLPDNKSMVGIIIGFNQTGNQNKEEYYLLNCQRSEFTLQKISDKNSEQLLKMNAPPLDDKSGSWKLKVLSSDNRIHIFNETRLLGNWEGSEKINGKIGFSVGQDVHARFYNLHLRGTKKVN